MCVQSSASLHLETQKEMSKPSSLFSLLACLRRCLLLRRLLSQCLGIPVTVRHRTPVRPGESDSATTGLLAQKKGQIIMDSVRGAHFSTLRVNFQGGMQVALPLKRAQIPARHVYVPLPPLRRRQAILIVLSRLGLALLGAGPVSVTLVPACKGHDDLVRKGFVCNRTPSAHSCV